MKRSKAGRFAPRRSKEVVAMLDQIRRVLLEGADTDPDLIAALMAFGWERKEIRTRFLQLIDAEPAATNESRQRTKPLGGGSQ